MFFLAGEVFAKDNEGESSGSSSQVPTKRDWEAELAKVREERAELEIKIKQRAADEAEARAKGRLDEYVRARLDEFHWEREAIRKQEMLRNEQEMLRKRDAEIEKKRQEMEKELGEKVSRGIAEYELELEAKAAESEKWREALKKEEEEKTAVAKEWEMKDKESEEREEAYWSSVAEKREAREAQEADVKAKREKGEAVEAEDNAIWEKREVEEAEKEEAEEAEGKAIWEKRGAEEAETELMWQYIRLENQARQDMGIKPLSLSPEEIPEFIRKHSKSFEEFKAEREKQRKQAEKNKWYPKVSIDVSRHLNAGASNLPGSSKAISPVTPSEDMFQKFNTPGGQSRIGNSVGLGTGFGRDASGGVALEGSTYADAAQNPEGYEYSSETYAVVESEHSGS